MKLGRLTLAIAIAGFAANAFLKNRDGSTAAHPDFVDTEPSDDAALAATPAGDMPADAPEPPRSAGLDLDSPNPAERMRAGGGSALAEAVEATSDDLFESNSQSGPYARTPGLPDLTRGA